MVVEDLSKGFVEMTSRFGLAEALSLPAALKAQNGQFPIHVDQPLAK